jgi:hypothetical protein
VLILLMRLVLTPATMLLASLVQSRWGAALGGRVVGLPLTTGPFLVLVLLTQGAVATAAAARGVVTGQICVVAFCVAYAHLAHRSRPAAALPLSLAVGGLSALALSPLTQTWLTSAVVLATIAAGVATWPRAGRDGSAASAGSASADTMLRVGVSGVLVATLTGTFLAGLLATTPVILSVLASTTHRRSGADAAAALLRGTLRSMPGTVLFACVVASAVTVYGGALAFLAAAAALVLADRAIAWHGAVRVRQLLGVA